MNTQTELHGKYQIVYRPTNNGITIGSIELIDKYTDIYDSSEGRFSLKVQIEDTLDDVVQFVYQEKLYMSKDDVKELVIDLI